MNLTTLIDNHSASPSNQLKPYVIAEAGVNHEGNMDLAYRLIDEAKEGGADAIKFQTYKAESIASKNSPSYWDLNEEPTESQYKLFQKYDKFWKKEFVALAEYCEKSNITFLSTPFDIESATFLNELMPVFKISSSDINNKPFIEYICQFQKPIILSTGASYMWEIEQSVSWIEKTGNPTAILHCILNYPTKDENAHLSLIRSLIRKFPDKVIGYSDHTLPFDMKTLEVASLLGAKIIEKHFTYNKSLPGNDHYHAMDKLDIKRFLERIDKLNELLGSEIRVPFESEQTSRLNARRSLVSSRNIPQGTIISYSDITWKRPSSGIDPRELDNVIGMVASSDIAQDTVLNWSHFHE